MKRPVLVLGGGIAGIQASTDLAEQGIPVFLVEKSPAIGGRMAQLDKTFPTNDCSACILAPKVTACFNHPLIKTYTNSELVELRGEAPEMTAVIREKPRYIDEEKCKGCMDCAKVCPISQKSVFDMKIGDCAAVYKPYAQAAPNKAVINKKGTSPCKYQCPAHMDAHGYIALAAQGRFEEALEVIRRTTPFAGVLGRVCFHSCEQNCTRRFVDKPLAISAIKRFIADKNFADYGIGEVAVSERLNKRVAIIGAGPAGLNCAYTLLKYGAEVTIFEKEKLPGGMLRYGIPDYRLDKNVLQREIDLIISMGARLECGKSLGLDFTLESLKSHGFDVIFIAIGAQKDIKLGIEGENARGVISGIEFLHKLNDGERPDVGKKVVVVGGGNVAMDAARAAIRLGCEVTIVYRRTQLEMPANGTEREHTEREGTKFEYLSAPTCILTENGVVSGIKCVRCELGEPDASGRRRPVVIEGSEYVLQADCVITAIGQKLLQNDLVGAGFNWFDKRGNIQGELGATPMDGVFAGGDAYGGAATVIDAIADGNRAANAIYNYITGNKLPIEQEMLPQTKIEDVDISSVKKEKRAIMPEIEPKNRVNSFEEAELGLTEQAAVAEAKRCVDCSICSECGMCEKACTSGAIARLQREKTYELPVSAVILCTGYKTTDAIPMEYSYKASPDIVTAMEYERVLSASGPFEGHVCRLSDKKPPKRVAFLQCVGSRGGRCAPEYCSSVCCMYAVKQAMITREHLPSVETTDIYCIDIRAYGKDFDRYVERAKNSGVNFIYSKVGQVKPEKDGSLTVAHTSENEEFAQNSYDLVVLSTGFEPSEGTDELLKKLRLKRTIGGFARTDEFTPVNGKKGIFICGAASFPKDIPETVTEASAAAAEAAAEALASAETELGDMFKEIEVAPSRDISKEPVRIGVFVCRCGVNIGGYVDVLAVTEYAKTLPFVKYASENMYTCSVDSQKNMCEIIEEYRLNRVVVASCTPRTHEPLFRAVLQKSGLNPYLFNMSNIRDQCSWVHMDDREAATQKAKELVRMAVGKVTLARQLVRKSLPVEHSALVIGGGAAGMSAALELAAMGCETVLVEKTERLGGHALELNETFNGRPIQPHIQSMAEKVQKSERIAVYKEARIKSIEGFVGCFSTTLDTPEGEKVVKHGAVIVAVGAQERAATGNGLDEKNGVITQLELEKRLREGKADLGDVVMLQCAGSRNEEFSYCSRVCCNQALRNSAAYKRISPDANILIIYKDFRSYGFSELDYKRSRQSGVSFARRTDDAPNVFEKDGRLCVEFTQSNGEKTCVFADTVVTASAIAPDKQTNLELAQMLKLPLNQDGFFLEAHAKLRPVDFATEGVFVCGLAHSPKNLRECITQGKAAAARAATVIKKDTRETEGAIANVDPKLCVACGACQSVCAFGAVEVKQVPVRGGTVLRAVVNEALCKGCGTCSANCRCGAIDVGSFADAQIVSEIEYLLKRR